MKKKLQEPMPAEIIKEASIYTEKEERPNLFKIIQKFRETSVYQLISHPTPESSYPWNYTS
jgi:hypothetical protein